MLTFIKGLNLVFTVILCLLFSYFGCIVGSYIVTIKSRLKSRAKVREVDSHCDSCGHTLIVKDVAPVYSYLKYKGKCRYCGTSIDNSYLRYEIIVGLVFFVLGLFIPILVMLIVMLMGTLVAGYYLKIK